MEQTPNPLLGDKASLVLATRDAAVRSGVLEKVERTLRAFFPPVQGKGRVAASSPAR